MKFPKPIIPSTFTLDEGMYYAVSEVDEFFIQLKQKIEEIIYAPEGCNKSFALGARWMKHEILGLLEEDGEQK